MKIEVTEQEALYIMRALSHKEGRVIDSNILLRKKFGVLYDKVKAQFEEQKGFEATSEVRSMPR